MLQAFATVMCAVLIGLGGFGLRRFNMLRVANETIELLTSSNQALNVRIDALEMRDAERQKAYEVLENKCQVLQEVVTNAAAVRTFHEDYLASVSQNAIDHQRITARVDSLSELLSNFILDQRKGE